MKWFITCICCLYCGVATSQAKFRTLVPQQAIVVGESFRVEYVAEDISSMEKFESPSFDAFRIVTGPEVYDGPHTGNSRSFRNTTYTLLATRPGKFKIPGAIAIINGKLARSNDSWIDVISERQAASQQLIENGISDNPSFLRPGEDPYEKIRQNLFVKVLVNKNSCYVGEAIVATFKLYSRLESRSEIAKNPGFYGFTVHDMIGLTDKIMTNEMIGGKNYDVHTIRKVQLYPLQPGELVIDPMEVNNKVEFSRSYLDKKPETDLREGDYSNTPEPSRPGLEVFESNLRTEPISIVVKPAPARNKPQSYFGATGKFQMAVKLEKPRLARNEEGFLIITFQGKGNFSQLSAPEIQWPAGLDGFDPVVTESLDIKSNPLAGHKTFCYPFLSARPGNYKLPTIRFSFFDPDSNSYKTISDSVEQIVITNEERKAPTLIPSENRRSIGDINRQASKIAATIVFLALMVVLVYWFSRKKEVKPQPVEIPAVIQRPSISEILSPLREQISDNDKIFYSSLYTAIWSELSTVFELKGTEMNKIVLEKKLRGINFEKSEELLKIIQLSEAGMFTNALMDVDREELLRRVEQLLDQIRT